ncbi:N-acetyltransferase family protein [Phycicoccus avicenniae]|uniref:GNAT family N-acetyltransferase n=1 Tax=Phycicoccus avicenniae TaxID=2828860 RepID=UPI003D2B49F2
MSDITVRPLDVEEWERFRAVRLTALAESPEAFVASHAEEEAEPEDFWRARMQRSTRLLAERDGEAVGIASVGEVGEDKPEAAQLFGLWVRPEARGSGVAAALVRAGAHVAAEQGRTQLYYWVGTDNGRAVAFASSFGFRPTGSRRPMRVVSEDDGEEEVAMTLPLAGDRGGIPTL